MELLTSRNAKATFRILFVTTHYPPNNTGAAVVMKNLIDGLNKDIVGGIATQANSLKDTHEFNNGINIYKIFNNLHLFPKRTWDFATKLLFKIELKKLCKIIERENISDIVGVYPDLIFLEIARQASSRTNTKFYPYLHDTIVEGLSHKRLKKMAKRVQSKVFENNSIIFVMSKGMQDLYQQKYGLKTVPLLHSFSKNESHKTTKTTHISNSIFWGGSIYSINKNAVKRIHKACIRSDMTLSLSAANKMEHISALGFPKDNIEILPFLSRSDYCTMLEGQSALLLAIDWPDESPVHVDELSTIFPTKTIEYLISGRPIIVHCPETYFLANFFREFDCGLLIHERNSENILNKLLDFLDNKELISQKVNNAIKASKQFHITNVVKVFNREIC